MALPRKVETKSGNVLLTDITLHHGSVLSVVQSAESSVSDCPVPDVLGIVTQPGSRTFQATNPLGRYVLVSSELDACDWLMFASLPLDKQREILKREEGS